MKKHIMLSRIFCVILIVLEAIPQSAVLYFASEEGRVKQEFSCFDLTPFGYANFGPFITAMLTVVLFILLTVMLFKDTKLLRSISAYVSATALLTSVSPILYGIEYMTGISFCISLVLTCTCVLLFIASRYCEK